MATYILLTKLTDHGRKTLKEKPNRVKEVNKEVEKMGARCWPSMPFWVPMIS